MLPLHRMAERLDLVPPEFGGESPVDVHDARAVVAEWSRYLRLWASCNPEEIFALKIGAVLLGAAIGALWAVIALIL